MQEIKPTIPQNQTPEICFSIERITGSHLKKADQKKTEAKQNLSQSNILQGI